MMCKFFKNSINIFALALLYVPLKSFAQDKNPISKISIASPTAASLGKFGDIPINYHTGIPNISIPIYTVTSGPLSLPISLSYHASGLKVQEPASWVGAGWALNAGGVITRSVMGGPDERGTNNSGTQTHGHFSDYGYNNYVNTGGVGNTGTQDWQAIAEGRKDGEPDLFFFNFGSYSGKFYFSDDRTPVIVPEADIKIEADYSGVGNISIQSFIVTTPDGVKYYFGNTPGLVGTAPIEITKPATAANGVSTANTISSWFLNKVETADQQFTITLSYQPENYGYHTIAMFPIDAVPASQSFGATHGYDLIKNIMQGVRLSQINFGNGNGTVNFIAGANARTDLSDNVGPFNTDMVNQHAKPLGSIQINNASNNILKQFNFTYSYFNDNTTALPQDIANFAPNLQTDKQRLRLDQLQELSGDGLITKPAHSFSYFNEQVPRRLSFGIDHWGFSNGVAANSTLIPTYTVFQSNVTNNYPGANRDANWPAMRGGTLQQINYPTGGYSLFEFEPNNVYKTTTSSVASNVSLTSLYVRLYGQTALSMTNSFVTDGTAMSMSFNNASNYSSPFTILNSSNDVVYTTSIGNNQVVTFSLTLPAGTYQATLSVNPSSIGGSQVSINQWQTNQVTTSNTVIIGGNRIKTMTHNDGSTTNSIVTSYNYTYDNGQSSAILHSRPAYVGIVRNDLIRDVGYWTSNGFTPYMSFNGCTTIGNASYYKSPSSIRPMATSQGNHIGYSQVKVSQTGNGHSVYKYYGPTGVAPWQTNDASVTVQYINAAGCDGNAPNYPAPPLAFDYKRGEIQYEAHYNQTNQLLKEVNYSPVFVNSTVTTPAFIVSPNTNTGAAQAYLGTKYELTTARKTQTQITETVYNPSTGGALTTSSNSYNESPFHHEVTRTNTTNSKGETIETKMKFAFDFRVSTCDAIANGYAQYSTDCASCQTNYNSVRLACGSDGQCLTTAYLDYLQCLTTARVNYVNYRKINFTNLSPLNTFQSNHNTAKLNADAQLKPILQLQDNYENPPIETSKWKNSNLLAASFSRYDYTASKVYINKVQAINLATGTTTFTNATTNAANTSIIKDSRYVDEVTVKFENGNMVESLGKDGITTAYIWGYNNSLPILKATGVNYLTLKTAYDAVAGDLITIRTQPSLSTAFINTYFYTVGIGMIKETDPNGYSKFYEYDAFNRLSLIRDQNQKILKKICYNYAGQSINCSGYKFYNGSLSIPFTRNNCGYGYVGTAVNYQVAANTYSSYISQLAADQLAYDDVNLNGQNYANLNGTCEINTICNTVICTTEGEKCVNGICEVGVKVFTETRNEGGTWFCTYHYEFSDGSWSIDYSYVSGTSCFIVN